MAKTPPYALVYADAVKTHLRAIDTKHHSLIRARIDEQRTYEPELETRNRKPLKRPISFGAQWELRLGPDNRFRVFYVVDAEARRVRILAIGEKDNNRLLVAGEELSE